MGLSGKSAPSAVVGLDIGSELIKVAEAKLAKDGIHITGLGIAPTPVGAVDNNIVVDPKGLGAAIKTLLRDSGIKTKTVVSSVSGQSSVVVRVIEVPKMTRDELVETMKWEVERHVPFSPTEIVMDFAQIEKPGADPDAQNMEVLLAVAQQDAINVHVETLFAAGLTPRAIDVQPLAVSRPLIKPANGSGPHTVAVVNIGATTTEVEVYEDGLLVFPGPPLPIAGINLTRAISEALGVSEEDAEMMKKEHGAADVTAMTQSGGDDDTGFDFGSAGPMTGSAAASPAPEPTAYNTSFEQADQDFSPFDFAAPAPAAPPPADAEPEPEQEPRTQPQSFDISGEDVFDLGSGGEQSQTFTPTFDLDDAPVAPETPPADTLSFDLEDSRPAAQTDAVDMTSTPVPVAAVPMSDAARLVNQAIAPVLVELATEVRRSLDYYATRYQNRPEQIFLCGGTAKLRDLDVFLSNELGTQVQVANPLTFVSVDCPRYTPQYLDEVAPLLPVSVGLAIRDMVE